MLPACGSSDNQGDYSVAPHVDFECGFNQALSCTTQNADKNVFIGLHSDANLECGDYLALNSVTNSFDYLAYSFDYSSVTKTKAHAGILTGVATQWVNSSLAPVYDMEAETYRVCAFIDLNENNALDVFEPVQESIITIGQGFLPLSNWTDY